jgi:hypothetical protein
MSRIDDRADQHDVTHEVGTEDGQFDRELRPHGVTDGNDGSDVPVIERPGHEARVVLDADLSLGMRAGTEPGQVEGDHVAGLREHSCHRGELSVGQPDPVQQGVGGNGTSRAGGNAEGSDQIKEIF